LGIVILTAALSLYFFRDRLWTRSEHIILVMRGSASLSDELMPKLAEAFLRNEMGAVETGLREAGRDAQGYAHLRVWGKVPGRSGLQVIEIDGTSSSAAFACLATESGPNSCAIGMSTRPINDSDKASYPALKNLSTSANEHVVALDGIAFIVNPTNPVSQLTIPQLDAIYSGEIRNWKDVGGNDAAIDIFGHDADAGTFGIFTERVTGTGTASTAKSSVISLHDQVADSGLIVNAVTHSPNAIGYVSSTMIRNAKAVAVSDGSGPPIFPTELSIATGDYPICRRLFLYSWDAPGSIKDAFIRYVVSKPGQMMVEPTPFVELTPKAFHVPSPRVAPAGYKEVASKYSRISLSFHFSPEQAEDVTSDLDSLARMNVLRLRTFLASHEQTGEDILLIGFADGTEGTASDEHIAQQRAVEIATSLRAIGVIVPSQNILNFDADLPIASNDTPEGRQRNRRVEVWVRDRPQ
jgi:phosphate transport system substrate-binding protein